MTSRGKRKPRYGFDEIVMPRRLPRTGTRRQADNAISSYYRSELRRLDLAYWVLVGITTILTLGRFSEAFLLLAAQHVGLAVALIPGVLVMMNIVYAASAYPFGRLSDIMNRRVLLALGAVFLIAADIVLAMARTSSLVFVGVILWGLHMGTTQG